MRFPFSKPNKEWPNPPEFAEPTPLEKRFLSRRLTGLVAVLLFGFFIYATDGAPWTKRLSMGMLFCGLVYMREDSPSGRWVTIGIIAVGTLLVILLSWFGVGIDFPRSSF